jgi:hypothetical protein
MPVANTHYTLNTRTYLHRIASHHIASDITTSSLSRTHHTHTHNTHSILLADQTNASMFHHILHSTQAARVPGMNGTPYTIGLVIFSSSLQLLTHMPHYTSYTHFAQQPYTPNGK